jgi:hypothetical protein
MNHGYRRVCTDTMILWSVDAKCSCKREKETFKDVWKKKGIESVISNIEEKKRKGETISAKKKDAKKNKPPDIEKSKRDKLSKAQRHPSSMPLEDIEQTASPPFISDLLNSIIDKTISITMTLLSRFRRWPNPRLETSKFRFLLRRVLLSEQMDGLSRTVTTLTALSPIVAIFCFSQHGAVQGRHVCGHT